MTQPDRLVQAAAEAMHKANCEPCFHDEPSENYKRLARLALAAAFDALPECPEAEVAVVEGISDRYPRRVIEHEIGHVVLAALAREFGDKK